MIGAFKLTSEFEDEILLQLAMMLGIPGLFAGIMLALSYKELMYTEFIMPVQLIMMALVILLQYTTNYFDVTFQMRLYQSLVYYGCYTILILFATATWHPVITLFRFLLVNGVIIAIVAHMSHLGDPIMPS